MHYEVAIARRGPFEATIEADSRAAISGGPPPEFGGDTAHWSPEHLLVASAALCFLNTLEWFARRSAVPVLGFTCSGRGTVAKGDRGLVFTGIRLEAAAATVAGQEEQLRQLMDVAKKSCLVASSLACPVELVASVRTDDRAGEINVAV